MSLKRFGSHCVNPDSLNYVTDDRDGTPSQLVVYFTGAPPLTFTGKDADDVAETLGVPKPAKADTRAASPAAKPTSFANVSAPHETHGLLGEGIDEGAHTEGRIGVV